MIQKVIQVGNSLAITIPTTFIKRALYKKGQEVVVETDDASGMLLMKPNRGKNSMSLTPEFYEWLENVSEKYEDVIKELANR